MPKPMHTLPRWPVIIAILLGVVVTVAMGLITWSHVYRKAEREFAAEYRAIHAFVSLKLSVVHEGINNLTTLFESSLHVEPDQFRLYARDLIDRHDYIRAIYYMPLVTRNERRQFENAMKDDGYLGFAINSVVDGTKAASPERSDYLPIRYLEPLKPRTARLLGFNFFAYGDFERAIRRAVDTAQVTTATSQAMDVFGHDNLLFSPIYTGKSQPQGVDARRAMFSGVVSMGFRSASIMDGAPTFPFVSTAINYSKDSTSNVLAHRQGSDYALAAQNALRWLERRRPIRFGDQEVWLVVRKPIHWQSSEHLFVLVSAVIGLLVTALLATTTRIATLRSHELLIKHQQVQDQVVQRTAELAQEKAALEKEIDFRRQAESKMAKLSRAVENAGDAIFITNSEGIIEYVNPAFQQVTGYEQSEVIGRTSKFLESGLNSPGFFREVERTIRSGKPFRGTFVNRRRNGEIYHEEKTISPLKNEQGEVVNFVSTGKDVTEAVQAQQNLKYLAHHDALTGLANRTLFGEQVEHALKLAKRRGEKLTIMFLDLDRFKQINDTLGHDVGDELIKTVAARLEQCVRDSDTVARQGGDEFTILLEDVDQDDNGASVARKALKRLAHVVEIDTHELYVTASVGIAVFPDDGEDRTSLMKHADAAMYYAKEQGKNNYRFYTKDMSVQQFAHVNMDASLRRGLSRNEFILHYQPQVNIRSGSIIGMEALLRWDHPDHGLVPPEEFIPILEETGQITEVGEWTLRRACEQNKEWQQLGFVPFRVSVNLSARQFNDPDLFESIKNTLTETGLDPRWLELEITETVIMQNTEEAARNLAEIGAYGVHISIDDFGTGYSSLNYLKRFPIDFLKIDRTFVREVTEDADDATIVQAITAMAHNLKLQVIAEGVETIEQLEFLRTCGCDVAQGNLFSEAIHHDQVIELLNRANTDWHIGPSASSKAFASAPST